MRYALTWIARLLTAGAFAFVVGFFVFANMIPTVPEIDALRAASTKAANSGDKVLTRADGTDGIVVLTGGKMRIREAVKLLKEQNGQRLLISGVNRKTTRNALQRLLPDAELLFNCCIDIGYEAQDTIGNADETKAWRDYYGFRRLIVVTSAYHMPRSMTELQRKMPTINLLAHPVVLDTQKLASWWAYPQTTRLLFSEYVKYIPAMFRYGTTWLLGKSNPTVTTVQASSSSSGVSSKRGSLPEWWRPSKAVSSPAK